MLKALYTIVALLCFTQLNSQNLEWVNYVSGDSINGSFSKSSFPIDITVDTENNSYLTGQFLNKSIGANLPFMNSVIKYNEAGEMCWYKNLGHKKHLGGNAYVMNITAEEKTCDLYSLMTLHDSVKIGDSSFYFNPNFFTLALVKTDSAYNVKWLRVVSDSLKFQIIPSSLLVTESNIYIQANTYREFRFKGTKYLPVNASNPFGQSYTMVLRLDKNKQASTNEWGTILYGNKTTGHNRLKIDGEGNAYCFWTGNDSGQLHINNATINGQAKQGIIKLNANNGELNTTYPLAGASLIYNLEVIPSGKMFVAVAFDSTFQYGNKSFTSSVSGNCLLLFLDNAGGLIWAIQEENSIGKGFSQIMHSAYKNGNFYCSGSLNSGSSGFKGIPITFHSGSSNSVAAFAKLDTLGNCLWAFADSKPNGTGPFAAGQDLEVDNDGHPIITGFFHDKVSLLDTAFTLLQNSTNTLIFKLTDYSIYRGYINSGPYCAGDTIEIPFTKRGKFKPANEFIAQLSDENGEFNGKERELGRLKDTTNGVVKGILPLFNVSTSGKYRIRILSTAPSVQSFYRQDTLRLLIYSRDSANAGSDTIVCQGQSIQLSTSGGSKWQWSPAASLDNSTLFTTKATPKANTRYRVIVSDSSGCGDTDTDYVWVRVRQPLAITAPITSFNICKGQSVKLLATGTGGDSNQYSINWYEQKNNNDTLIAKNTDSLLVTNSLAAKIFFAVLYDNCSLKPDTQAYTISIANKPKATFVVSPLYLEVNKPIRLISTSTNATNYQWNFGNDTFTNGTKDALVVFDSSGFKTIALVAENSLGCKDTAYKTIRVFEKVYCTIPNAFSPNGDGLNNTFAPVCEGISDYTLTIYNRWGQVIFQQKNGAWDGNYIDKPVPEGVYMYKIHLHAQSKNKSMVYGSVNIIR